MIFFCKEILKIKDTHYFILLSIIMILLNFYFQSFVSESVYFNSFSYLIDENRIDVMYEKFLKTQWIILLVTPFFFFIKILYNSLWVTIATLLNNSKYSFQTNFSICLKAEFIFALLLVTKVFIYIFFKQISLVEDLNYVPGSLLDLLDKQRLPKWSLYFFQTINIWELLYIFFGCLLFSIKYNTSLSKAIVYFLIPYVFGLFFLLLIATFFLFQVT